MKNETQFEQNFNQFILHFSSLIFILIWKASDEWFCFSWSTGVLMKVTDSVWALNWGEKNLKTWTWNSWKFVTLKNVLSQWSGASFRAWRDSLRKIWIATFWNSLLDLEDLVVWFWQPGENVHIAMRWT